MEPIQSDQAGVGVSDAFSRSPLLGTIDTPWEDVEAFYRFWREFKSWRVYSAYDEYNPEAFPVHHTHNVGGGVAR